MAACAQLPVVHHPVNGRSSSKTLLRLIQCRAATRSVRSGEHSAPPDRSSTHVAHLAPAELPAWLSLPDVRAEAKKARAMNIITKAGAAALLASLAACGTAETEKAASTDAKAKSAETHTGTGSVDSISGNQVTISHGPIRTVGWPAMTMAFTAEDPALLNGIKAGDRVSFAFSTAGSTSTLTSISKQ